VVTTRLFDFEVCARLIANSIGDLGAVCIRVYARRIFSLMRSWGGSNVDSISSAGFAVVRNALSLPVVELSQIVAAV
jgi:hypothetical protein